MAEEMDKKAAKKAEKARKKAEKKTAKNMETDLENTEEEEGSSSKLAVALVTLVIIIVWLAILALLIKWDVGGFGSTVMRPLLKDIPYVNRILPDSEDDLSTEEDYPYKNMDEAVAYIKELEQELAQAQQGSSENSAYIADLEAQSQKLKEYEANKFTVGYYTDCFKKSQGFFLIPANICKFSVFLRFFPCGDYEYLPDL